MNTQMVFLSSNMKSVHVNLGPDLSHLNITELKQVPKHLLQIILCGHIQRRLSCVVLHRHQISHRGPLAIVGELLHQLRHGVDVAGSDGGEEGLVGQEPHRLEVHYELKRVKSISSELGSSNT